MNEILSQGGTVTLLGLSIVFVCLILIIFLITLLAWILKDRKKKTEPKIVQEFEREIHKPMPPVPVVEVQQDELIAVLTAAVAACLGTSPSGLVVRSYKRVSPDSAWARAGRSAQIYNKF